MDTVVPNETQPLDVRNIPGAVEKPWQTNGADDTPFSFGSRSHRAFSAGDAPLAPPERRPHGNLNGRGTHGPEQIKVPSFAPVRPPMGRFGLKAWRALSHWEGVVEEVTAEGFRLRLTPLVDGRPDFTRVEFADFGFDELAYEADRPLVVKDAILYWTVGPRRDEAGTISNQSFVRVRRQARPSLLRQKRASKEVAEILSEVKDDE